MPFWASLKEKMGWGKGRSTASSKQHHATGNTDDAPFGALSEVAAPPPVQNRDENAQVYTHHTMEDARR